MLQCVSSFFSCIVGFSSYRQDEGSMAMRWLAGKCEKALGVSGQLGRTL